MTRESEYNANMLFLLSTLNVESHPPWLVRFIEKGLYSTNIEIYILHVKVFAAKETTNNN